MESPFPGMDPFLEGYLWPDVQHSLVTQISDQLMPHLRPHYVARIQTQIVEDEAPEAEIGITYPAVKRVLIRMPFPILPALEVRLASVHILDAAQNQLITSIEILSPVNKHEPGVTQYREKRQSLHEAGVHLLEKLIYSGVGNAR